MIMSQGSYHRNSKEGEWNWPIDPDAGPDGKGDDYIDWKTWLGPAPKRPLDADRFFRFRKYWDYSGGIATDLFFHVAAPLNICWSEPQFPYKVMAGGGIYVFKDTREVPDTFHLIAEYAKGHSVVLTSSMANSQHIPGPDSRPRRHHHHGGARQVRRRPTTSRCKPEKRVIDEEYKAKFGEDERRSGRYRRTRSRAHHELPGLRAQPAEADAGRGDRGPRAGAHLDVGGGLPARPGAVLRREDLEGQRQACQGLTAGRAPRSLGDR